jgi:AMP nucleosidase
VRFWEFNEDFKKQLKKEQAHAIDMECATLFSVGFARKVPIGALMLISDLPLMSSGIKTAASARELFQKYTSLHIDMGIEVLQEMQRQEDKGHCYQF